MIETKVYLRDELNQKTSQKIISYFQMTKYIGKDEPVLSVFGTTQLWGISSSVVSTNNRLVYLDNSGIASKFWTIPYAKIKCIDLTTDNNWIYVLITNISGEQVEIAINASADEAKKFYDFLVGYRVQGANEPESEFEKAIARETINTTKAGNVELTETVSDEEPAADPVKLAEKASAEKPVSDPFDEIKKFKDLLDHGIVTQEEFDKKKKQLLGL